VTLHATWKQLGLERDSHAARDLWDGIKLASSQSIEVALPAHGSTIYQVQ
jgi:hypothetical protein